MEQQTEELVRFRYDWSETEPSTAIITAIAEFEGVARSGIGLTLYDYIDPDAVDNLFPTKSSQPAGLDLHIEEYRVHIDNDGIEVSADRDY